LVFPADMTKNRSERYAILPVEIYAALDAYKGKTHLWEDYPAELMAANKAKGYRRIARRKNLRRNGFTSGCSS
jgi:hypothetical protein